MFNGNHFGQLSVLGKLHLKNLEMSEGQVKEEPPKKRQKTTEGTLALILFTLTF